MKEFSFEYGRENETLKKIVSGWLTREMCGGYVLTGATGSGKTVLLRGLLMEMDEPVEYLTGSSVYEKFCQDIRQGVRQREISVRPETEVVFIDDLDDFMWEDSETEKVLVRLLCNLAEMKRLVVCMFTNQAIAERFATNSEFSLVMVNSVSLNERIVCEKAKEVGVRLSVDQIQEYADFSMQELYSALNEVLYGSC